MKFKQLKLIGLLSLLLSNNALLNISHNLNSNVSVVKHANYASGSSYYATNEDDKYYQGIDDTLVGEDLIIALSTLTSDGFESHTYSSLPTIYQYSDVSLTDSSKMVMAYTGTEVSFTAGSMPSNTNKEHVWPASWYGNGTRTESAGSPGADAHNVWPAATDLNSKRGSCAFDELDFSLNYKCYEFSNTDFSYGDPSDDNTFVWSTAFNTSNGKNTDAMYPAKGHRGQIARILMYVATRYYNDNTYPVMLHDEATTLKTGRIGKLSTLLKWHFEEPPTEWEINRNNEVASRWHHNRNPFVDHPEYAARIYYYMNEPDKSAPTEAVKKAIETYGSMETPTLENISISPSTATLGIGDSQALSIVATPTNASKSVTWSTSNSSVATVSSTGVVTGISKGNAIITATSVENDTITSSIEVNVKELSSIEVTGTLTKTSYYDGDKVDPTGLTVTVTYSDGSTSIIDNSSCAWLDGTTRSTSLSKDTTSIICKYNDFEKTIDGITVLENTGGQIEISISSFTSLTSSYAFQTWTSGGVTGEAFIYGGTTNRIQLNNSKSSYYLYNTTALPGSIKSVSISMNTGTKDWEVRTSSESFGEVSAYPTGGTSQGTISATTSGTKLDIADSTDKYFTINYKGSGVAYIDSIIIEYGSSTSTPIEDSITLDKTSASLNIDEYLTLSSNPSTGVTWTSSNTSVATVANGVVHAIAEGTCTITAKYGTASATCTIQVTQPSSSGGGDSGENNETPPEESIIDVTAVKLDKTLYSLKKGETCTLVATVLPSNASDKTITWTSSDTNIATVNNGVVEAKNVGETQIKATANNGLYCLCKIYVEKDDVVIIVDNEQLGNNNTLDLNVGDSTSITLQDEDGTNLNVTYESINPNIVEIDSNGNITVKADGVAQIKITDEEGNVTIITINATTKSNSNPITKQQRIIIVSVCVTVAVISLSIGIFVLVRHNKKLI
ncbi:MAG: Ig-like domain-containing protein [Bacilli bacterium]